MSYTVKPVGQFEEKVQEEQEAERGPGGKTAGGSAAVNAENRCSAPSGSHR